MSNAKIFVRNALTYPGAAVKGTNAGATLIQNNDWPMSNLLSPDRETYWRTSAVPPSTYSVDLDLGSSKSVVAAGIAKVRGYAFNAATGLPAVPSWNETYYEDNYPPTNPLGTFGPTGNNNNFLEFGAITARYWSFEFTSGNNPFSCKLWLVLASDVIDIGKNFAVGTDESNERFRQVVSTPSGLSYSFEPVQERGTPRRSGSYRLPQVNQATRDLLRDQLSGVDTRVMIKLGDGKYIETTLQDGRFSWIRKFAPPEISSITFDLVEHP